MALSPRSAFALEQHDVYEGVAEILAVLDPSRIRQLQDRFARLTAVNFAAGVASGPFLNCADFVAAFDSVLPSVEAQLAMQAEAERVEAALSRGASRVSHRRRRDGVLASYPRRAAALATLFELCDSTGSGLVEMRDVQQYIGDRVRLRGRCKRCNLCRHHPFRHTSAGAEPPARGTGWRRRRRGERQR